MKNETKQWFIPLAILAGLILINNAGFFGINLQTSDVQFYNKDISLPFTVTNFSMPTVEAYFNDVRLFEVLTYQVNQSYINQTTNQTYYETLNQTINQTVGYTKSLSANGTYTITLKNINVPGLLKIKIDEGNKSETKSVEIRQAYVDIKNNIPNLMDRGTQVTIEIGTFNPQGDALEADSVDIDVYTPANEKQTIFLTKSGSTFTKLFNYENDGNYQFKIHARKEGYITKEVTVITAVTKTEGVHPIVYVFAAGAILWILLFIIKLIRVKIK